MHYQLRLSRLYIQTYIRIVHCRIGRKLWKLSTFTKHLRMNFRLEGSEFGFTILARLHRQDKMHQWWLKIHSCWPTTEQPGLRFISYTPTERQPLLDRSDTLRLRRSWSSKSFLLFSDLTRDVCQRDLNGN